MKVNELKVVPGLKDTTKNIQRHGLKFFGITKFMQENGWRAAGSGSFGTVYKKKNTEVVIKQMRNKDSGYGSFVNYAKTNKSNPHIPRIAGPFMAGNNVFYILEKLEDIHWTTDEYNILEELISTLEFNRGRRNDHGLNDLTTIAEKYGYKMVKNVYTKHKTLMKTLLELKHFKGKWIDTDWNPSNFMMRPSTGDIVITDPFYDNDELR